MNSRRRSVPGLRDLQRDDHELAADILAAFAVGRHCTMATLRADGAPRISGTEVEFVDGNVFIEAPADSRKAVDLLNDPRVAIHSPTRDPAPDNSWPGEAKFSGIAVVVEHAETVRFRIDLTSAVFTGLTDESPPRLRIRLWRPDREVETIFRV